MAGDGVSLPTTIAQMGSVAKTQAKAQQSVQTMTTFADQLDKKDELKVKQVKEMEKTEQQNVDPEANQGKDKRQRRRQRREKKILNRESEMDLNQDNSDGENNGPPEHTGTLVDLRA